MDAQREAGQRLAVEYGQRVIDSLCDILDFVEMAANLTAAGRRRYNEDINLRLAGEAICHRMGEAAARLLHTDHGRFADAHPEIDWVGIRGLRNVVAGTDHRILWNALVTEFPADAVKIRAMLGADLPCRKWADGGRAGPRTTLSTL